MTPRPGGDRTAAAGTLEDEPEVGSYLYGIVPAAAADGGLDDLTGLDGAPLEAIVVDDVAAVVGRVRLERPPGRRADLVAHSVAVDTLAQRGPVVPVRFGSMIEDVEGFVAEYLAPRSAELAELLADLRGRSQFTVRATYDEETVLAEIVATDPEVARLRERTRDLPEEAAYSDRVRLGELVSRALDDRREAEQAGLLDAIVGWTAAHVVRRSSGLHGLLDLAVLVDDEQREGFEDALEELAEAGHPRYRIALVGPAAPYDFVGDVAWG